MSVTNRQNRLLLSEDWKRVYQSFRNADINKYILAAEELARRG